MASTDKDSGLVMLSTESGDIRFLNPAAKCACEPNNGYESIFLVPSQRSVFAVRGTNGYFWRVDSSVPIEVTIPDNAQVGLLATQLYSIIGYQERSPAILRRGYNACPLSDFVAVSPFGMLPGMAKYKYTGEAQTAADAFMITNDPSQPAVLEDIARTQVPSRGFHTLELPVTDHLGVPINWDHRSIFSGSDDQFALCDDDVVSTLSSIHREIGKFSTNFPLPVSFDMESEIYKRNGAVITGHVEDDTLKLTEDQTRLKQMFRDYKDCKFGDALNTCRLVAPSPKFLDLFFRSIFHQANPRLD